jgi:hypothetical protein
LVRLRVLISEREASALSVDILEAVWMYPNIYCKVWPDLEAAEANLSKSEANLSRFANSIADLLFLYQICSDLS